MSSGLESLSHGISGAVDALGSQPGFGCVAIFLSLVFVLSSVPKMRKPQLAAMALTDFGVTTTSKTWLGFASGALELVIAMGLIVAAYAESASARFIPVALAAVMLWMFVALLARALLRSESFACFCFGGGEATISKAGLIRTLALALVATALSVASTGSASSPTVQIAVLQLLVASSILGSIVIVTRLPTIMEVTS